MPWREENRARWFGVRPAHGGIQVVKSLGVNNTAAIVHTVTAAKTFYLTFSRLLTGDNISGAGLLWVRDTADVLWFYIDAFYHAINTTFTSSPLVFFPPVEIPSGYDIVVQSTALGLNVTALVGGWEE